MRTTIELLPIEAALVVRYNGNVELILPKAEENEAALKNTMVVLLMQWAAQQQDLADRFQAVFDLTVDDE